MSEGFAGLLGSRPKVEGRGDREHPNKRHKLQRHPPTPSFRFCLACSKQLQRLVVLVATPVHVHQRIIFLNSQPVAILWMSVGTWVAA